MPSTIISLFEAVANTSSRKEKEKFLSEAARTSLNEIIAQALQLACDPFIVFGVTCVEAPPGSCTNPVPKWDDFVDLLQRCARGELSGNEAEAAVNRAISTHDLAWNKWSCRIVNKDLRIGAGAKTINKAFGREVVRTFEMSLCEAFDLDDPENSNLRSLFGSDYYIEPKMDGWRCIAHYKKGVVRIYSRQGKPIANTHHVVADIVALCRDHNFEDVVLDGELYAGDFKLTDKICGTTVTQLPDEMVQKLRFHVFDVLSAEHFFGQGKIPCTTRWLQRREKLEKELALHFGRHLALVPSEPFDSRSLAQYENHLGEGWEGSILKRKDVVYEFSRTKSDWHKLKPVSECDLVVHGFEVDKHGTTLGALLAGGTIKNKQGQDIVVVVKIGTGLCDEDRTEIWANQSKYRNKTVEVGFQEICKAEGNDTWSLRFPRFRKWKNDR